MDLTDLKGQDFLLELGPRNGGAKTFPDEHSAAQFLVREISKWAWLKDHSNHQQQPPAHPVSKFYTRNLGHVSEVKPSFSSFVELGLPLSSGAVGKWILKLNDDGKDELAFALVRACLTEKNWIDPHNPTDLNAVVSLAFFEKNIDQAKALTVNETLNEKINSFETNARNLQDDVKTAVDSMNSTNKAYAEEMKLNASYGYWVAKSSTHAKSEADLRWWLLRFAPISVIFVLLAPLALGWFFGIGFEQGLSLGSLWLVTTTVLFSSVAFWVARILTRLYLSQKHLRIDADERATMVQSFVALTKEQAVDSNDRATILSALFRPTADGLVKDDAAPDMLAQIFSRIPSK